MHSLLYGLLALFGLGLLVFIHELGHYFMARRVGMKVEAFGIGFGKPLYTWEHKGVKWNLCWLPFGGYVRIAGMEKQGSLEPSQIEGGFYSKRPIDRIKVAVMGPVVNIVFTSVAFVAIWAAGGREKPFSEYTHLIGWVDPQSKLYEMGVRPGDEITMYGKRAFDGFDEMKYAALIDEKQVQVQGFKIDYLTGDKTPFKYTVNTYRDPRGFNQYFATTGIMSPASYLVYDPSLGELPEGSPMLGSGLEPLDRIVWVDGEFIFSQTQLSALINEPKVLLTVQRGSDHFLARVPYVRAADLRMDAAQKAELDDWQHSQHLNLKSSQMVFIPCDLNTDGVVEQTLSYIDEHSEEHSFDLLQKGDKIIAVSGLPISSGPDLLSHLQKRCAQIIVQRGMHPAPVSWKVEDADFESSFNKDDLRKIINGVGLNGPSVAGNLVLLAPVTPKPHAEFLTSDERIAHNERRLQSQKEEIGKIKNPEQQAQVLKWLENSQKRLALGLFPLRDREVSYNPAPWVLFGDVLDQTWRTLSALFTGALNPKWMSGPIGIVQVMHYGWGLGVQEALYWMAVISLNLGILNLFPIPVLDGGHICFALWESITKKPIKAKTMERLVIPFIVLLIGFFIYVTFNDLARLFGKFF
jgi:regulator of sigma E protease